MVGSGADAGPKLGPRLAAAARGILGRLRVPIAVLLALAAGIVGYVEWSRRDVLPEGLIQANGRIEGDRVVVASRVAGRVRELRVREGDAVRSGQVLVLLDEVQADARVAQARAALQQSAERRGEAEAAAEEAQARLARAEVAVAQARARAEQARQALASRDARLRAARTALSVLVRETTVAMEAAATGLIRARSELRRAEAAEEQARRDAERYHSLVAQGLVEPQRGEQASLAWITARNETVVARAALDQAQQQEVVAGLGPDRVRAQGSEVEALESERAHAVAGVTDADAAAEEASLAVLQARAARAQAQAARRQAAAAEAQARAVLAEAESLRGDLTIGAPIDGIVTTRTVDTGEVVGVGAPLLELVDLDRLYLRVFVAETDIGRVRLGLPAQIYTDAFPERPFPATVRFIASRAEFTPKEVQTPEERVKLVYAVKLYLEANPDHRLTPGLPADAMIRWKDDVPWRRPRW